MGYGLRRVHICLCKGRHPYQQGGGDRGLHTSQREGLRHGPCSAASLVSYQIISAKRYFTVFSLTSRWYALAVSSSSANFDLRWIRVTLIVRFNPRFRCDAFMDVGTESETEVVVRRMVEDAHLLGNSDLPEQAGVFDVFRRIKQRESVHTISHSAAEITPNAPVDDAPPAVRSAPPNFRRALRPVGS